VRELIAFADRLLEEMARRNSAWVVTHGEPHAANAMRTPDGYVLIDWDTVALAPAERDLWMLGGDLAVYTEATGHAADEAALSFYRLAWDLGDLAEYVNALRGPHADTEDMRRALGAIVRSGRIRSGGAG
jgi:spectinomycin phosphotransferase